MGNLYPNMAGSIYEERLPARINNISALTHKTGTGIVITGGIDLISFQNQNLVVVKVNRILTC